MADDIQVEEFNRGDSAQDDRLRPGDGGTAGGSNANSDLREKGDADDLAEAVIQGDAEGATHDVGLRSDSPRDLTREAIEDNERQVAVDEEIPVADSAQTSNAPAAQEPMAEAFDPADRNGDTGSRSRQHTINDAESAEQPADTGPVAASAQPAPAVQNGAPVTAPAVNISEEATENIDPAVSVQAPDVSVPGDSGNGNNGNGNGNGSGNGNGNGNGGVGNGNGQGATNGQGNGNNGNGNAGNGNNGNSGSNGNGNGNGGVGNGDGQGATNGQATASAATILRS